MHQLSAYRGTLIDNDSARHLLASDDGYIDENGHSDLNSFLE